MAQVLKDEIEQAIGEAALRVFARKGFRSATMAEIGREAGVSTGNIYRYYRSKDELYHAVITDQFAGELLEMMRRRVRALDGIDDVRDLPASAPFHAISEELLGFCIANRLRVVVLLGRSEGTSHAGFTSDLVALLSKMAIAHFRGLDPDLKPGRTLRFNLERIYESFVTMIVAILVQFERETDIRQAVADFSRYHLAGMKSLFA